MPSEGSKHCKLRLKHPLESHNSLVPVAFAVWVRWRKRDLTDVSLPPFIPPLHVVTVVVPWPRTAPMNQPLLGSSAIWEVQWLKQLILNHPYSLILLQSSAARRSVVLAGTACCFKSQILPIHPVLLHLSQGSLALEAIKFTHASQFNYASVMSPEIPRSKTYGAASHQASSPPQNSMRNVNVGWGICRFHNLKLHISGFMQEETLLTVQMIDDALRPFGVNGNHFLSRVDRAVFGGLLFFLFSLAIIKYLQKV